MTQMAVYRLYDEADRLLYVGASLYPHSRLRDHEKKAWGGRVARKTVEWHPDKKRGLAAEAAAIKTEHPEFNIMYATPFAPPEERLTEWAERHMPLLAERDGLVRAAYAADVSVSRIRELTGLSRTTIYRVLGVTPGSPAYDEDHSST